MDGRRDQTNDCTVIGFFSQRFAAEDDIPVIGSNTRYIWEAAVNAMYFTLSLWVMMLSVVSCTQRFSIKHYWQRVYTAETTIRYDSINLKGTTYHRRTWSSRTSSLWLIRLYGEIKRVRETYWCLQPPQKIVGTDKQMSLKPVSNDELES